MQFSWRNAHSYYVSSATKTVRAVVTVFVAIFLTSLWYFFVNVRLQTALAVCQSTLEQLSTFDQTMSTLQATLQEKNDQHMALQEQFTELVQRTSVFSAQDNMFFVLGLLEQHGLQLTQYEPQAIVDKKWYVKQKIKTSFCGSYQALNAFFAALTSAQRAVIAPGVSVQRLQDGMLRVQTELCFFHYKKDAA